MKINLLEILRCPITGQKLTLDKPKYFGEEVISGILSTDCKNHTYSIKNGIPRFVPPSNYADNFGLQWNHFRKTQLDSFSGHPISCNRFFHSTGWSPKDIEGKWVLDIGCGSGRFAEIALQYGAHVVALDYSSAIDACYENLGKFKNLHCIQGDIYSLPFADLSFEFIYSLGVLQHTPDVKKAFCSIIPKLNIDGRICVDFYPRRFSSMMHIKYILRPITSKMSKETLFKVCQKLIPTLFAISNRLRGIPVFGKVLMRMIPVANYSGDLPLSASQLREWALLDTFDWLSPLYDRPQTATTVRDWFSSNDFKEIEIIDAGHLVARGVKVGN